MPAEQVVPADEATVEYFDGHLHEYGRGRLRGVARLIGRHTGPGTRLVDVGCGTGTNLARLARVLGVSDLTAIDVSGRSLERAGQRLPEARLVQGSILDEATVAPLSGGFDVVLMAAVLHHLVGPTRRSSRERAVAGVAGALRLLAPGGVLVVLEPVIGPRAAMGALFWAKRGVTTVTSSRVPVLGYWNNIGAPVVSFYGPAEVEEFITTAGGRAVRRRIRSQHLTGPARALSRGDGTWIVTRPRVSPRESG